MLKTKLFILGIIAVIFNPPYAVGEKTIFLGFSHVIIPNPTNKTVYTIDYKNSKETIEYNKLHMNGMNLQYHHQWDHPLGIFTSLTTAFNHERPLPKKGYIKSREYHHSFILGPVYKVHKYISVWGGVGGAYTNQNVSLPKDQTEMEKSANNIIKIYQSTSFSYGGGVMFKLGQHCALNISYHGSRIHTAVNRNNGIHGVHVGVGYQF